MPTKGQIFGLIIGLALGDYTARYSAIAPYSLYLGVIFVGVCLASAFWANRLPNSRKKARRYAYVYFLFGLFAGLISGL